MCQVMQASLLAIRTLGHTDESTSYVLNDPAVFTGDTLFTDGVGHPDLHANADTARAHERASGIRRPPWRRTTEGD
jgi:glyoxylase-like metal-dependent hydrolase (beta-lactamase superfamily II)